MSKISGKETKHEILVRKYLFENGFRYRKNLKSLPGSPDIVLSKYKTVIFVHGCFWHGHDCKSAKIPTTRTEFWKDKIMANSERDRRNVVDLQALGWKVIIIWQCSIRNRKIFESNMNELSNQLKQS